MNAVDVTARGLARRALDSGGRLASPVGAASIGTQGGGTVQSELGYRQVTVISIAAAKALDLRVTCGDVAIVIQDRQSSRWIADDAVAAAEEDFSWFRDAGGTVWRLAPTQVITPFMLGGATAGDAWRPLQFCLDYAAANGTTAAIHARFETSYPIYLPARGCVIDGAGGWIVNTNTVDNVQHKLCLIPGNYSAQYYSAATLAFRACAPAAAGQASVITAAPGDAGSFAAGDSVFVRSTRYYLSSDATELPLYGSFNEVTAADPATGEIQLTYPIKEAIPDPLIAKADLPATPDILHDRGLYCCVRPKITGGLSLESLDGNCMERGGALGADFEFGTLRSLYGWGTNGICFSRVFVRDIEADRVLYDMGACSTGTDVSILNATYRKTARSRNLPLIAINENALAQTAYFVNVDLAGFDFDGSDPIRVGSASKCELTIANLNAPSLTGAVCRLQNSAKTAPETQPDTKCVKVRLLRGSFGAATLRVAQFDNAGGHLDQCHFEAALEGTPKTAAITLDGSDHTIRGTYPAGAVSLNTSTGCDIDVRATSVSGFTGVNARRVVLNGAEQYAAPKRRAIPPGTTAAVGNGAPTITPDFALGVDKGYAWAGATAVAIADPANALDGETVELALTNGNGSTAIAPAWGGSYVNTASVAAIAAGKTTLVRLRRRGAKVIVTPLAQNYAG